MSESIWKKELSFGRKKAPKEPQEPQPEAAPADGAPAPDQPTSVWKKEVSFGRKKAEQAPKKPKEPKAAKPAKAEGDSGSIWKKELSFGRKKAEPAPAPAAEPEAEARVSVPAPVEPQPERELVPEAIAHVLGPVDPVPAVADVAAVDYGFLAPDEPVAPAAPLAAVPPVAPAAAVAPVPVPIAPAPPVGPEPVAAQPVLAPAPAPAPVPYAPPQPEAVEPEAVTVEARAEPEKKVPFWKKDLSFGGAKAKKPKAEKQPKPAKRPKAETAPKEQKAKKEKAPRQPRRLRVPKIEMGGGRSSKRLVGLKIGASQLAAARVSNNGVAELLQVAREPLDPGIVVGGELREPDALAAALREFFKKNRLPTKGVRLGIANNRIGVRIFEIDGIDDPKQLDNAIKFRAQEALPIPIADAVLDYQVLGAETREDGQQVRKVLLVVAYRDLVDRYIEACRKAGITLSGIDLEAFALLRALQAPQAGAGGNAGAALVAVAIGHDRSTFAVSDGRVCEFTRVLDWGGAALNVALARTLDAAPSEVEELKRALPLTNETVPDGLTSERAAQARDAMRRAIQAFARELVSSLQFYQNQPGSLGIGEIVLSGGTAHLVGLAEELERLIGVRVRVGDPLARMKVSKKVGEPDQVGSLAVAIGLGIED
jgi:type IV pilus assembly protein PilM